MNIHDGSIEIAGYMHKKTSIFFLNRGTFNVHINSSLNKVCRIRKLVAWDRIMEYSSNTIIALHLRHFPAKSCDEKTAENCRNGYDAEKCIVFKP